MSIKRSRNIAVCTHQKDPAHTHAHKLAGICIYLQASTHSKGNVHLALYISVSASKKARQGPYRQTPDQQFVVVQSLSYKVAQTQ